MSSSPDGLRMLAFAMAFHSRRLTVTPRIASMFDTTRICWQSQYGVGMVSRTIGTRCRSLLAAVGALTLCVALGACGARHDERAAEGGSQAAASPMPSQTAQERTRGTDSLLSADLIEQIRQLDGNSDPQTTRSVFAGILFNGPGHESPGGPGRGVLGASSSHTHR